MVLQRFNGNTDGLPPPPPPQSLVSDKPSKPEKQQRAEGGEMRGDAKRKLSEEGKDDVTLTPIIFVIMLMLMLMLMLSPQ